MTYKTKEFITILLLLTITISFFAGRWTALEEVKRHQTEQTQNII